MTIAASLKTYVGPFAGDGVSKAFGFPWPVFEEGEVAVWVKHGNGSVVQLVPQQDYTVDAQNQVVTLEVAPDTGTEILIQSDYQQEQDVDFGSQSRFFPQTHEHALDYTTLLIKQLYREFGQLVADSSNPFGTDLSVNSITVEGDSITTRIKKITQNVAPEIVRELSQSSVQTKTEDFVVSEDDYNVIFVCRSDQDITVTLPVGISEGFFCGVVRGGQGRVFIEEDGTSEVLVAPPFLKEVRAINSIVSASRLDSSTEEWLLTGDLADSFYP